jgi:hypothetical protein
MQPPIRFKGRDPRVDLLRGFALLSIFVDHIPANRLADFTFHNFGFSDAAELFVILAGYSATLAYGHVFERDGLRVGLKKVLLRCLKIYGVQVGLLLVTLWVVTVWTHLYGRESLILGPMLRDGIQGTVRGLALWALPTYLDILPLYILLLASFPLIRLGMAGSIVATIGASFALYGAANVFHWDLPNFVDPASSAQWYFNPFTWQLVFVSGAALAVWSRDGARLISKPPMILVVACWAYLVFAFVALDAWKLWPTPFGSSFPSTTFPFALFGNEPKSFVTPWRLFHVLAIVYLALTSPKFVIVARLPLLRSIVACGRHSLQIFAIGCLLALFGRLIFKSAEVTVLTQIMVNGIGLGLMLVAGTMLDQERAKKAPVHSDVVAYDAGKVVD